MNPALKRTIVVAGALLVASSPQLMGFVEKWESGAKRVLVVYPDKLAGNLPTVCNGLTRHVTKTPIIVGERWTDAKCEAEEEAAIFKVQTQLAPCFKVAPSQVVFDMFSSHAWNLGASATCSSGAMAAFNRGDVERACQRLSRGDDGQVVWSFVTKIVNGKKVLVFVQGLANRRADESKTCMEGWS